MKNLRKWLAAICLAAFVLPVLTLGAGATVMENEGLRVSVVMDKEHYAPGEAITATFTVENISGKTVTVNSLEQLIPEGYQLAEGSEAITEKVDLSPGQTLTLSVTYAGDPEAEAAVQEEDFFHKIIYGKTCGLPNLLLILIAGAAFAVFMFLT